MSAFVDRARGHGAFGGLVAAVFLLLIVVPELALAEDAQAVLRELRALRSVTRAGLNFAEYQRRVLDAKIAVDRYLSEPGSRGSDVPSALGRAMHYYVLAATAWNAKITREGFDRVGSDGALRQCAALRQFIERSLAADPPSPQFRMTDEWRVGGRIAVNGGIPVIWNCAEEQIGEAERLMAGPGRER